MGRYGLWGGEEREMRCGCYKAEAAFDGEKSADRKKNKLTDIILLSMAFLLVLMSFSTLGLRGREALWTTTSDETITLINEGKALEGKAGETWMTVISGGSIVSPEKILSESVLNTGWWSKDDYLISTGEGAELTFTCKAPSDLILRFDSHEYAGQVKIICGDLMETYNFYSQTSSSTNVYPLKNVQPTYNKGVIALLASLILVVWGAGTLVLKRHRKQGTMIVFAVAWIGSGLFAWKSNGLNAEYGVILLLSAAAAIVLFLFTPKTLGKYCTGRMLGIVSLFAFYFTFALIGNGLFMQTTRMNLTPYTISYFVLCLGMLFSIVILLLIGFDFGLSRTRVDIPKIDERTLFKVELQCAAITAGILWIVSLAFHPGTMTLDGTDHWLQAVGIKPLQDAHPVPYTLMVRMLSKIVQSPYTYTVWQILLFSLTIGRMLTFLYKKGVSKRALFVMAAIVAILPNNHMTLMLLSKNPMFSILNLYVLILLIELADDPEQCACWQWNLRAGVGMAALYLVRYNTSYSVGIAFVVILLVSIFKYNRIKWKVLPSVVVAVMIIVAVQGPIMGQYEIIHNAAGVPYTPLVTPLTAVADENLSVSEETEEMMLKILPIEEWDARDNAYDRDQFSWREPFPNFDDVTLDQVFSNYLGLLAQYPDIVIKDRLQGCDLLWSICESPDSRGYNHRFVLGIPEALPRDQLPSHLKNVEINSAGQYQNNNVSIHTLIGFSFACTENDLIDMFVWRCGIYVVLAMGMLIVLVANKRYLFCATILPTVVTFGTLGLAIGWQMYQYVYFLPLAATAFILCALVSKKTFLPEDENEPEETHFHDKEY